MVGKEPANWLFQSGLRPANMPYCEPAEFFERSEKNEA